MVIILHFIELIIISVKPAITTEFFTLSKNSPMTLVTQTRKIRVTFNFSLFYYHAGSSMTGTLLSISALDLIQAFITLDQTDPKGEGRTAFDHPPSAQRSSGRVTSLCTSVTSIYIH